MLYASPEYLKSMWSRRKRDDFARHFRASR